MCNALCVSYFFVKKQYNINGVALHSRFFQRLSKKIANGWLKIHSLLRKQEERSTSKQNLLDFLSKATITRK